MNWKRPWRLKPDDGPHTIPCRQRSREREYELWEPTSSMWSTAAFHGNSTGARRAYDLGPGTRSPGAVVTLIKVSQVNLRVNKYVAHPRRYTLGFASLKNVPRPVIVPDLLAYSDMSNSIENLTWSSHAGANETDFGQLSENLWPSPSNVGLPVLRQAN